MQEGATAFGLTNEYSPEYVPYLLIKKILGKEVSEQESSKP